jgi:hypothetical protein
MYLVHIAVWYCFELVVHHAPTQHKIEMNECNYIYWCRVYLEKRIYLKCEVSMLHSSKKQDKLVYMCICEAKCNMLACVVHKSRLPLFMMIRLS